MVNVDNISDVKNWLNGILKHDFLTFTYQVDEKIINFLDVQVLLNDDNTFRTSVYHKPMSKHQYLHYYSNHPFHCKKSLPYSQALRIIRICSEETDKERELKAMETKFLSRCFPKSLITNCMDKIKLIKRECLLKPKKNLLISTLRIHNPEILEYYGIDNVRSELGNNINTVFITVPFYKSIRNLGNITKCTIMEGLLQCEDSAFREIFKKLTVKIAHKKVNSIESMLK